MAGARTAPCGVCTAPHHSAPSHVSATGPARAHSSPLPRRPGRGKAEARAGGARDARLGQERSLLEGGPPRGTLHVVGHRRCPSGDEGSRLAEERRVFLHEVGRGCRHRRRCVLHARAAKGPAAVDQEESGMQASWEASWERFLFRRGQEERARRSGSGTAGLLDAGSSGSGRAAGRTVSRRARGSTDVCAVEFGASERAFVAFRVQEETLGRQGFPSPLQGHIGGCRHDCSGPLLSGLPLPRSKGTSPPLCQRPWPPPAETPAARAAVCKAKQHPEPCCAALHSASPSTAAAGSC